MAEQPIPDYDHMWEDVYGDLQDYGPTHRHMIRLMRKLLAPLHYRSVLDVGVGFGHNLPALSKGRELDRIAGVDVSERALEHVRRRWHGEFRQLDIAARSLPEQFDLICCALVLEHVPDDVGALTHLREMTAGHLLITTMAGDYGRYRPWEEQVGHVRNYARGELEGKLRATGFEVVRSYYWGFPFYSPLSRALQNRMKATHELSAGSRLIARLLYPVYFLNSSRRGDLLVLLARPI